MRLLEVLLHGGSQWPVGGPRRFSNPSAGVGLSARQYTLTQLRYDMRKMKGHGLVERDRRSAVLFDSNRRGPGQQRAGVGRIAHLALVECPAGGECVIITRTQVVHFEVVCREERQRHVHPRPLVSRHQNGNPANSVLHGTAHTAAACLQYHTEWRDAGHDLERLDGDVAFAQPHRIQVHGVGETVVDLELEAVAARVYGIEVNS